MASVYTAPILTCRECLSGEVPISLHTASECMWDREGVIYDGCCENCNKRLYVCICCGNIDFYNQNGFKNGGIMTSTRALQRHCQSEKHQRNMKEFNARGAEPNHDDDQAIDTDKNDSFGEDKLPTESGSDVCDLLSSGNDTDDIASETVVTEEQLKRNGFHPKSNSPRYYYHEHKHPGQGIKFLTAQAYQVEVDQVSVDEARFSLVVASLLVQLSDEQRELFAECMLQAGNWRTELSIFQSTFPPTDEKEFQDLFLKSRDAIIPNLPHPVPCATPDGTHAYVTLKDVLANELAKGTQFDRFGCDVDVVLDDHTERTISTTPAAFTLLGDLKKGVEETDGFVMYLWLKEWRDDFDPNNTKSSRSQVWTNTYTICPPANESGGRNTYFMSLGSKGDDHSQVENILADELIELHKTCHVFYHGRMKRFIKVKIGKISTCVDRIERTAMFRMGDCGGTYSTFWGHSCAVDGYCDMNHLPSCRKCRNELVRQQLEQTEPSKSHIPCPDGICSSWNVMDPTFDFIAPQKYPTICDNNRNAPSAPMGREVPCKVNRTAPEEQSSSYTRNAANGSKKRARVDMSASAEQRLKTVKLTIEWLMQAIEFAHHNMKTKPDRSIGCGKQRYWNQEELKAYLQSCCLSGRLVDAIYKSAKSQEAFECLLEVLPPPWKVPRCLDFTNNGPMHTYFLGGEKSNIDMTTGWLSHYKLQAAFGKQANQILNGVRKLRATRFFAAFPFSTSSWGTGVWVSENYLFYARTQKYFLTMPAVNDENKKRNNENFAKEIRMIFRFTSAAHAFFSRVMSREITIPDLERVIKIYLDTMVEVDMVLLRIAGKESSDDAQIDVRGRSEDAQPQSGRDPDRAKQKRKKKKKKTSNDDEKHDAPKKRSKKKKGKNTSSAREKEVQNDSQCNISNQKTSEGQKRNLTKEKKPNFTKSVNLGLMDVAASHQYHGNAHLHWEGGYAGERKIQSVKPLLHIKRSNADWQTITLRRLYQHETIKRLLESSPENSNPTKPKRNREMDGILKIYRTRDELEQAVQQNLPMTGILCNENRIWLPYRPTGKVNVSSDKVPSRSLVELVEVNLCDDEGMLVEGLCWMAPITVTENTRTLLSVLDIRDKFSQEYVLLLPQMQQVSKNEARFVNMYYCIGHEWTERSSSGLFSTPQMDPNIFQEWLETD